MAIGGWHRPQNFPSYHGYKETKEYHHGNSILSTQGRSLVNKKEFVSFYTSLCTKDNALCIFPNDLDWSPIDQQQVASLEVVFTEEEVGKVIQHLGFDKTPGLNGFTLDFF